MRLGGIRFGLCSLFLKQLQETVRALSWNSQRHSCAVTCARLQKHEPALTIRLNAHRLHECNYLCLRGARSSSLAQAFDDLHGIGRLHSKRELAASFSITESR